MIPATVPEQRRGVLERGTAKLYLLELNRTVILSNAENHRQAKQSEATLLTVRVNLPC